MKTTSIINLMPSRREEINNFVEMAKNEILTSGDNPLMLAIQLKAMEEVIAQLRKDGKIRTMMILEAVKYGEKSFNFMGATLQIKESGVKYDYTSCGDSEWERLDAEINALNDRKKSRENFLKALTCPIAIPETGEIINPPIRTATETLNVTLK